MTEEDKYALKEFLRGVGVFLGASAVFIIRVRRKFLKSSLVSKEVSVHSPGGEGETVRRIKPGRFR